MMLPSDMALIRDPAFRKYTEIYAKDGDKFFDDFAKAFQKLNELGAGVGSQGLFGLGFFGL
jgi:catalase (peroxidase I)